MTWADRWPAPGPRHRIVLATDSAELVHRIQSATDDACLVLPLGPLPASPAALFALLTAGPRPEVLVLDSGMDPEPALRLAARFDLQCPGISVIVVSDLGIEIGGEAMRSGVRGVLHPIADAADIGLTLGSAFDVTQTRGAEPEHVELDAAPLPTGRVISVVSAKGGVGKTTVATNLAVGLARTSRNSTVLVDLDVQFGDVASALNLEPEYCLPDAVRGPASRDAMVLKTFLSLHETGLYVICGPRVPADADTITGEDISHLLRMLASEFSYVVVDTAPGLAEHVMAAMDETNDLVLVTSMDVPGVRGLRKELDALNQLNMLIDNRSVVLNFVDDRGSLSMKDVEATLGTSVDFSFPRSRAAMESVNQGVPLVESNPRDAMARQLGLLASRFTPESELALTTKGGWFTRRSKTVEITEGDQQPKRAAPRWYRVRRAAST